MTHDESVTAVLEQGGFDVSGSVASSWLNAVHKKAVAKAKWMTQTLELGPTVAAQSTYAIPERVADIVDLYLDDGSGSGQPSDWQRKSTDEMWALRAGRRQITGSGGVFAPAFGEAGEKLVELYPVPVADDIAIVALAAMTPATVSSGGSWSIPDDMHEDLVEGAIAMGLRRMDERSDSAQVPDAIFREMVMELSRRKVSQVGSQSTRIRVRGHDF